MVHECQFCPYTCDNRTKIIRHERIHTGEKPYQCQACMKSFTIESNYTRHLRVHQDGSTFKCSFCDALFMHKKDRTIHERAHWDDRPQCDLCGRRFTGTSCLAQHMELQHKGLKQKEPQHKELPSTAASAPVVVKTEDGSETPQSLVEPVKDEGPSVVEEARPPAKVEEPSTPR